MHKRAWVPTMKKTAVVLAALIVLAAAGAGAWWYAADRGYIAGKPNSPRPENFKAAIDRYLAGSAHIYGQAQPCVQPGYYSRTPAGWPDLRFDMTPTGFRFTADAKSDPQGQLQGRFQALISPGFFEATTVDGTTVYTMTWKGYAASNGNGCFAVASAHREAKIIGFEPKRIENHVAIYEVTARAIPRTVEPWAQTESFKNLFATTGNLKQVLDPNPVTYELARTPTGFTVINERGRQAPVRPAGEDGALTAKLAGAVTPNRVQKALEAYFARTGATQNRLCLRLPQAPGEADETGPGLTGYGAARAYPVPQPAPVPPGYTPLQGAAPQGYSALQPGTTGKQLPMFITFYNVQQRERYGGEGVLRGYELMRRLESLRLATSELVSVNNFNGIPAQGAVRFTLSETVTSSIGNAYDRCYPVGTLQLAEVLRADSFLEGTLRPRFVGRMALVPAGEHARRVIEKFGHLARVQAVGAYVQGTLRYADGELQVENAQVYVPNFAPDVSQVALPVIAVSAAPSTAARSAAAPGAIDLHAIGVYEGMLPGNAQRGFQQHPEGTVEVVVNRTPRPVVLFLSSYESVNWVIRTPSGTRIAQIVLSGYHPQRVSPPNLPGAQVIRIPYAGGQASPATLARAAQAQLGIPPLSAQYNYNGRAFEVGSR